MKTMGQLLGVNPNAVVIRGQSRNTVTRKLNSYLAQGYTLQGNVTQETGFLGTTRYSATVVAPATPEPAPAGPAAAASSKVETVTEKRESSGYPNVSPQRADTPGHVSPATAPSASNPAGEWERGWWAGQAALVEALVEGQITIAAAAQRLGVKS